MFSYTKNQLVNLRNVLSEEKLNFFLENLLNNDGKTNEVLKEISKINYVQKFGRMQRCIPFKQNKKLEKVSSYIFKNLKILFYFYSYAIIILICFFVAVSKKIPNFVCCIIIRFLVVKNYAFRN